MPEYDKEHRITSLLSDEKVSSGRSVCNHCKKEMPICWDAVCYLCRKTFCYKHVVVKDGKWFCLACRGKAK